MTGSRLALGVELGSGCVMHDSSRLKIEIFEFWGQNFSDESVRVRVRVRVRVGLG